MKISRTRQCSTVLKTVHLFAMLTAVLSADASLSSTLFKAQQEKSSGMTKFQQEQEALKRRFRERAEARNAVQRGAECVETYQPSQSASTEANPPRVRTEAEQAEANRLFQLGWQYEQAMGEPGANFLLLNGKAIEQYRKAAEFGHPEAYYRMAGLEMQAMRENNAIDCWLKAIDEGHERSFETLNSFIQKAPIHFQSSEVKRRYVAMARKGNEHARQKLNEEGIPWDVESNKKWGNVLKAEEERSRNVEVAKEKTEEKARLDAKKAKAEQGDAIAQLELAIAYEVGNNGVEMDKTESFKWYRKLCENALASASIGVQCQAGFQTKLGTMYEKGIGVNPDIDEAVRWYRAAARSGDSQARDILQSKNLKW